MNLTDIIILLISAWYLINGWQRGFLRTIFGPISLIIGSIVSYIYFQQTHDLIISLLIGLGGPFILNLALNLLITIWQKATDEDKKSFTMGRLLGSICNLIWGTAIIGLIIFLIILTPLKIPGFKQIQQNIKESHYYSALNKIFSLEKQKEKIGLDTIQTILNDPDKMARFQESETFRELVNDGKMKDIFQDEALLKQIKNNDFSGLLKNPKFAELLNDEELTAKILSAYRDLLKLEKTDNKDKLSN